MEELSLAQICLIYNTDKNSYHSYVDGVYEELFRERRHSTKKVLEIGVEFGGSILMWRDYFPNAEIFGLDKKFIPQMEGRDRIRMFMGDAYSHEMADNLPDGFDVIVEDGPHTLDTMTFAALEYSKKLSPGGVLVLEDFQDFDWTNVVRRLLPEGLSVEVRDLRMNRNRYDDIAMIITRA